MIAAAVLKRTSIPRSTLYLVCVRVCFILALNGAVARRRTARRGNLIGAAGHGARGRRHPARRTCMAQLLADPRSALAIGAVVGVPVSRA